MSSCLAAGPTIFVDTNVQLALTAGQERMIIDLQANFYLA